MVISLKIKTLDSRTYDFTVDDEISVRQFKEAIAEKTNISADLQRLIYCGRVLVDEKPLKEYDVDGKVVHVVERAPPSSRISTSSTDSSSRRPRDGLDGGNILGSPIFRALDGMVLGAMTVNPTNLNGNGSQGAATTVGSLNPSPSFSINRLIVARHMLDCANNIALYLENPERGLNNTSLDILTQGRWTMESAVVEVGISTIANVAIPQNQTQNIAEALQGAVSAALRNNGHPHVTVVQLPPVIRSNSRPEVTAHAQPTQIEFHPATSDDNGEEQMSTNENEGVPDGTGNTQEQSDSSGNRNRNSRSTIRLMADVVSQMQTVKERLEPFVRQYLEILQNDPAFDENDTSAMEDSQRIFDRVSEALHYMAHAQHAISDIMLDLSQPPPRSLCCRPILIDRGGFVSSNNVATFLQPNGSNNDSPTANNNITSSNQSSQQPRGTNIFSRPSAPSSGGGNVPHVEVIRDGGATATNNTTTSSNQSPQQVRLPRIFTRLAAPPSDSENALAAEAIAGGGSATADQEPSSGISSNNSNTSGTTNSSTTSGNATDGQQGQSLRRTISITRIRVPTTNGNSSNVEGDNEVDPQIPVARLIQAVLDSTPFDTDLRVQINGIGFGYPVGGEGNSGESQSNSGSSNASSTAASNATIEGNNSGESIQARVTTATHPTTSTQTRSTARPQVHVGNIPTSWNSRVIPSNMLSSFDRFLPCSSHHIRENEQQQQQRHQQPPPQMVYQGTRFGPRVIRRQQQQATPQQQESSTSNTTGNSNTPAPERRNIDSSESLTPTTATTSSQSIETAVRTPSENIPINLFGSTLTVADLMDINPSPTVLNRIRNDLFTFIRDNIFRGESITAENMNDAINVVIESLNDVLVFLPQFDLPDYDARASVENLLRESLPSIINLISEDSSEGFGIRLLQLLIIFIRRLFVLLVTCVGRNNAEIYLNQITARGLTVNNTAEQEGLRALQRNIATAIMRELDTTRVNSSDVQNYLVTRRPPSDRNTQTPMDVDEINDATEQQNSNSTAERNESLPSVVVGAEPWHNNFPTNWLPIITRDIEKQRRQSTQPPFSDAYISGMSAKRRKLITSTKCPSNIPCLISDSVRQVIQSNSNARQQAQNISFDEVTNSIATDPSAQSSYLEAFRSSIQERLRNDPDYSPEKFPNSSKYFNNNK